MADPRSPRPSLADRAAGQHRVVPAGRRRRSAMVVAVGVAASLLAAAAVATAAAPTHQSIKRHLTDAVMAIQPSADSFVSFESPNKNYVHSGRITAGYAGPDRRVGYLVFNIPAAVASRVSRAVLTLTRDDHHMSGTVSVRRVRSIGWNPASLTARNAPALGAAVDSKTTSRATNAVEFDLTDAVAGRTRVAFGIVSSLKDGVVRFRSSQAGAGGGPVLRIVIGSGPGHTKPSPGPTRTRPVGTPTSVTAAPSSTVASSADPSTTAPTSADPSSSVAVTDPSTAAPSSSAAPSSDPAPTSASSSPTAPGSGCTISRLLVPSCGELWGIAPRQFTSLSTTTALAQEEALIGRDYDVLHEYHRNDDRFPTPEERGLALQPGHNRILFENWKVATDMTWSQVAAGGADARIDAEAAYLNSTFHHPFFLTVWHEPENDVVPTAGSGMTASDYAAMFRHVVQRLRADGVTYAVTVFNLMGYVPWAQKPWFNQLWPGDNVVDWIGIDPYISGDATGYLSGDFNTLINRTGTGFAGFYNWMTTAHPGHPIMIAEWGVFERSTNPDGKPAFFQSVADEAARFPAIKAMIYYDMYRSPSLDEDTSPDSSPQSLAAYRALSALPRFNTPRFQYTADGLQVIG